MKYFLDTEFYEERNLIDLISLALVAEDGRELYLVNKQFNQIKVFDSQWHIDNVIPSLPMMKIRERDPWSWSNHAEYADPAWCHYAQFGHRILSFLDHDPKPEFWGYYADYDWVAFCWIFGRMIDLPRGFPMYCRDLKQVADDLKIKFPQQLQGSHNALADARWVRDMYIYAQDQQLEQRAREQLQK